MASHVPRSMYASLFMLTAFPAAIVGLATALAVGASPPAAVAITLACLGLGSLSLFVAVALTGDSGQRREHESEAETRRRTLPGLVRTAGLVFLPSALLLGLVLGITLGRLSGLLFVAVAVTLTLYQIAGFQLVDAWLYRRYGGCVREAS
jgi:hypothetical protein